MRASRRDGRQAWLIVVIMGLYFFVDLFQAALIGVGSIEAVLQQDFGLSNSDLAWLVGMFGWGNLLVIPFVGLALSRYSVRKITLVMLAICGFGALGTACASAHWMFFLFRAISGFSHAFCFLCATTLVTRWFSARRGGVAMGVFVGLGLCGPIIAHAFLAQLTNLLGSWRYALALFAVLPLLLFVLAFFVLQDDPDAVADVLLADRPTFKGFMQQVREVA
ncbi:MAG: MFS transporter, partial [Cytophagales bacterium]